MVAFAGGFDVGPDRRELVGTGQGSAASGDFLVDFHHAEITFGLVVIERDFQVPGEREDVVSTVIHRGGKVKRGPVRFRDRRTDLFGVALVDLGEHQRCASGVASVTGRDTVDKTCGFGTDHR